MTAKGGTEVNNLRNHPRVRILFLVVLQGAVLIKFKSIFSDILLVTYKSRFPGLG